MTAMHVALLFSLFAVRFAYAGDEPVAEPTVPAMDAEAQVRATYAGYRQALVDFDAATASALVDRGTIGWYQDALKDALELDAAALARRDAVRRLTVLGMRVDFDRSQLEALTGATVFTFYVEHGRLGKAMVEADPGLGVVTIDGRVARAEFPAYPGAPVLNFVLEGGTWKIALWKSSNSASAVMDQLEAQSGMTDDEFFRTSFANLLGRKVKRSEYRALCDGPRP